MALKRLNAEHYLAIGELSRPKAVRKTVDQIAEICGVHRSTIFEWKKDETFNKELKRQIVRNSIDKLPDIFESIPEHIIRDGNAAMLKTFLQTHDMLTDRLEVSENTNGKDIDREAIKERLERLKRSEESDNE